MDRAAYFIDQLFSNPNTEQSEYSLKVKDAREVHIFFEKLDELKIKDAFISKVDQSKIHEYRKEVRILAIKAAKEKADYLLEAIGAKTGNPLVIKENGMNPALEYSRSNIRYGGEEHVTAYKVETGKLAIEFKKIKVKSSYYVKFEIEG